jgi:hypothetical protein
MVLISICSAGATLFAVKDADLACGDAEMLVL